MPRTDAASPTPTAAEASAASTRAGLAYGVAAYAWWGLVPGYFKLIAHVPATVVLGHRIVWSVLLLAAILGVRRRWGEVGAIAGQRTLWPWLGLSTLLIAGNWLVFIYAVATGRLLDASLGYFINPLVMILLGMVFLGERMRPAQWAAAGIAAAGVGYLSLSHGGLPWIAMVLPVSFGLYGLVRKRAPVGPVSGLFVETALLGPASAAYLMWFHLSDGPGVEAAGTAGTLGLLLLAGVVTTAPLLWFVAAAQRLRLVTLGFLQYLSPTLQFFTAVLVFGEPFGRDRAITFALIWVALGIFAADSIRRGVRGAPKKPEAGVSEAAAKAELGG